MTERLSGNGVVGLVRVRPVAPRRSVALCLLVCALASGCMVVPHTTATATATADPDCAVVRKRIHLSVQEVEALGICRSSAECAGLLAFYGFAAAASVVVSGSIAVVGNVAYWLEAQGQCRR